MVGFRKGTSILIGNNLYKNIEELKKDDHVLSYNEETHELVEQIVVDAFTTTCNNITTYKFDNGTELIGCDELVFLTNEGYKENIQVGDIILSINGETALVEKLESNQIEDLYELDIEDIDNYIAKDIVVHNARTIKYYFLRGTSSSTEYPTPCGFWTKLTSSGPWQFNTSYSVISMSTSSTVSSLSLTISISICGSTTEMVSSSEYQFSIDNTNWYNFGTEVTVNNLQASEGSPCVIYTRKVSETSFTGYKRNTITKSSGQIAEYYKYGSSHWTS